MSQDAVYDLMPEAKREGGAAAAAGRTKRRSHAEAGRKTLLLGVFGNCFSFLSSQKSHFRQSRSTRKHDDVDTRV